MPIAVAPLSSQPAAQARLEAVIDMRCLDRAWRRVRGNHGGPGGDGVTIAAFEAALVTNLRRLADELAHGRYRPGPLRRSRMPKPAGGFRELAIPCVRDRVAQAAVLDVLQPQLDLRQSPHSFAYRKARGVREALEAVRQAHQGGLIWTAETDIAQCFDTIAHASLMAELAIWLDDERLIGLVGHWLYGFGRNGRGIAQGAPISPLLANLFLHPMDRLLRAAGHLVIRYADDFLLLSTSEAGARQALGLARAILAKRGLALKQDKTRIVPPGTAFQFLGVSIRASPDHAKILMTSANDTWNAGDNKGSLR